MAPRRHLALGALPKLLVPLRLAAAQSNRQPASLWVLRKRGMDVADALYWDVDRGVRERLSFVASCDADPVIVVRGDVPPPGPFRPEYAVVVEAYTPLLPGGQVYAPVGHVLQPPMSRDAVRRVLAVPDVVVWLVATARGGSVKVERVPEAAFVPMGRWPDYMAACASPEFAERAKAATFAF